MLKIWFANLPIRHKLLAIGLISLGSALLLVSLTLASLEFFSARQRLLQDTQVIAHLLGENSSAALVFQDQKAARELLYSLRLHPEITQAALYLPDGQQFAVHRKKDDVLAVDAPPTPPATIPSHTFSWRRLEVFEPISLPNQSTAVIGLHVNLDLRYQRLLEFIGAVILTAFLALLAALWLLHYLQQLITRPLLELTDLMRAVSDRQDYTQRTAITRHDEIGLLAQGFNAMLGVIERRQAGLKRELHEHENINRQLGQLARYDTVTGLANRHAFNESLKVIVDRARTLKERCALMFVDLDRFKPVNDTFGHHVGDELLRSVAQRLTEGLRESDIVCRIGGDEFAILLENITDSQRVGVVAEKIIQALTQPFAVEGHTVQIGASVGISVYPDDSDDSETLLHYADIAMYHAKKTGKGRHQFFHAKLHGLA